MILGYADRLSVAPGQRIQFMVSCDHASYNVAFVRLTGANRRSPAIDTLADRRYSGRLQAIRPGSYGRVEDDPRLQNIPELTIQLWCMPTRPARRRAQALLTRWTPDGRGFGLWLEPDGRLAFRVGDRGNTVASLVSDAPLIESEWYFVAATYSTRTGQAMLQHVPSSSWDPLRRRMMATSILPRGSTGGPGAPLLLAAALEPAGSNSWQATDFFNGKLEAPRLFSRVLSADELDGLQRGLEPASIASDTLVAAWDFSQHISSLRFIDVSGHTLDGQLINMPARGMTGHAWTGRVLDFPLAPRDWGAIHFHEDDLDDAGWDPDFSWTVPNDLTSGVYAALLTSSSGDEECIPFFVRRQPGEAVASVAFLAPTMTYVAYANYRQSAEAGEQMGGSDIYELVTDREIALSKTDHFLAEHPELGLCIYETHSDRSANFYSSRLRPIVNMRPGYHYWMTGAPRHFAADLLLVEWLEDRGVAYDVITDEDLHAEGEQLLSAYRVLITGSHPEYWTQAMLDSLESYLGAGGRLMYLGGNGLWWVTSVHPERPHVIEVRKGVMFMPASTGLAGETCHSTTGERGGAWRDRGRAPQRLLGVGLTAMGWGPAPGYSRLPDSFDPRVAFIFDGVGADETIGDFGLVLGGAAGDEIDRFDRALGSPADTLLLATSSGKHSDHYQLLPWDVQTFLLGHGGTQDRRVRADMSYFETRNGGAVFSVGSINWIGSLMFNGGDNNVSIVTENVIRQFMK